MQLFLKLSGKKTLLPRWANPVVPDGTITNFELKNQNIYIQHSIHVYLYGGTNPTDELKISKTFTRMLLLKIF